MDKFKGIFNISFTQEFVYKTNFIMWRVRNFITILLIYFLWNSVFYRPEVNLFGYNKNSIMTYVIGIVFVKAFVLSSRAVDVSGNISSGDIVNILLKPVNYFKYWITRDIASKTLNLSFGIAEIVLLVLLFRPDFFIQTNLFQLVLFTISLLIAAFIFFCILFIVSSVSFWAPEQAWGAHFLITVVAVEFLSGGLYPLDVFPQYIQDILNFTPFPYMVYFPIKVYIGTLSLSQTLGGIIVSVIWAILLHILMRYVWKKGLMVYQAYGR